MSGYDVAADMREWWAKFGPTREELERAVSPEVDYRVRNQLGATVSEVRARAALNRPRPLLDPICFDPPITMPKGPPPRDERIAALEAEVAELRSRLAECGGFR